MTVATKTNSRETLASIKRSLTNPSTAYTTYFVTGHPGDSDVEVVTETNDNGDTGYPGEYANWAHTYATNARGTAYDKAIRETGVSRFGIGHTVAVYVNGILV
ncbi:MAG: hypothetical protein NVS3B1_06140 [Marmoricola sp.]